ncbi:MAG: hypothetical protein ACRDKE_03940 [Solirubrobacterales bacterium]
MASQVAHIAEGLSVPLTRDQKRTVFAGTVALRADGLILDATYGIPDTSYALEQLHLFGEFGRFCGSAPRTALVLVDQEGVVPASVLAAAGDVVRVVPVRLGAGASARVPDIATALHERMSDFTRSAWCRRNEAFVAFDKYRARMEEAVAVVVGEGALSAEMYELLLRNVCVDLGWRDVGR